RRFERDNLLPVQLTKLLIVFEKTMHLPTDYSAAARIRNLQIWPYVDINVAPGFVLTGGFIENTAYLDDFSGEEESFALVNFVGANCVLGVVLTKLTNINRSTCSGRGIKRVCFVTCWIRGTTQSVATKIDAVRRHLGHSLKVLTGDLLIELRHLFVGR